jgi:hypothetical protein
MNAKQELVQFLREKDLTLKCAEVRNYEDGNSYQLRKGHSRVDLAMFLDEIDFDYDAEMPADKSHFGNAKSMHLNGALWFTDGTWADRDSDAWTGQERWDRVVTPTIPPHLHALKGD